MEKNTIPKKPKENILYINGMHCPACELLIEKKLLKKEQVSAVDVSMSDKSAKIYVERGSYISIDELNETFKDDGYSFAKEPFIEQNTPFVSFQNGRAQFNQEKLSSAVLTGAIAIFFLALFYLVEKMQLGQYITVTQTSSLVAFLLLGVVAGISSCAALIGGILLSLIKHWNELFKDETHTTQRKLPHILFHSGRLASFFILGGLLGLLGDAISLDNATVYASLILGISIIMFILALQMLGVHWAQKIQFRLPKFITRTAANEQRFSGKYIPFITGALTFFLPCGFTLIAQGVALASGNFFTGGFIMLFFALGTLPTLLAISWTGLNLTQRPHKSAQFSHVAGVLIIFFSLYNINGQLNVLGLPSLSDVMKPKPEEIVFEDGLFSPIGQQEVRLIAQGFEYIPNGPTIFRAGTPTKLVIDNQGILGCGSFVASRGLIDNFIPLEKGLNTIDVGIPKPGSYKITCSMGMVPPVTITFK